MFTRDELSVILLALNFFADNWPQSGETEHLVKQCREKILRSN